MGGVCSAIGWKWGHTVVPVAGSIPRQAPRGAGTVSRECSIDSLQKSCLSQVIPTGLCGGCDWYRLGHGAWGDDCPLPDSDVYST